MRGYDVKADVYSAVMSSLVMMAGGRKRLLSAMPGRGEGAKDHAQPRPTFRSQVRQCVANGPGQLGGVWAHSELQQEVALDFFRQGLCQDPDKRPSAEQLLSHPWLAGEV